MTKTLTPHPVAAYIPSGLDEETCWKWLGPINKRGVAVYKSKPAGRYVWEHVNGQSLDANIRVLRRCDDTTCVNPSHLALPRRHRPDKEGVNSLDRAIAKGLLMDRHNVSHTGCWEWTGPTNNRGYGMYYGNHIKGSLLAHRVSYFTHCGEIADGQVVCHRCDNPPCINPNHLFLGTQRENSIDMSKKGRGGKCYGEAHQDTKLTDAQVVEVRALHESGMGYRALGRKFGMTHSSVMKVCKWESHRKPTIMETWEEFLHLASVLGCDDIGVLE